MEHTALTEMIRDNHDHDYPVWDDYFVHRVTHEQLKYVVVEAMADPEIVDFYLDQTDVFVCDSCGHEERLWSSYWEYDELSWEFEGAWQVLVPFGTNPRVGPGIVNCPDCEVAR